MRIGPLISLLSATYGIPEPTVTVIARALREAGLLTTGARGVNAPEMTMQDVARLTIALMTGEPPSKVVEELRFISRLQTEKTFPSNGWISSQHLGEGHTLEHAITEVFSAMLDRSRRDAYSTKFSQYTFAPSVEIALDTSKRAARIQLRDVTAEYTNLVGHSRLDELYATRPMTYEIMQEISEIETRGMYSFDSHEALPGRGMRVVRSITDKEVLAVCDMLQPLLEQKHATPRTE